LKKLKNLSKKKFWRNSEESPKNEIKSQTILEKSQTIYIKYNKFKYPTWEKIKKYSGMIKNVKPEDFGVKYFSEELDKILY